MYSNTETNPCFRPVSAFLTDDNCEEPFRNESESGSGDSSPSALAIFET